jgi:hypothetical protein
MTDDQHGFRGPHLRTKEEDAFQGPHLGEDDTAKGRGGFQGLRLLLDDKETHSVRLHSPDVMRRIAGMAYSLWAKRGSPHGINLQDWILAEKAELDRIS